MKKHLKFAVLLAAALCLTTGAASAKGHGDSHGKPAETGIDHAGAVANSKGVTHGIDNAEAKQSVPKRSRSSKSKALGKEKRKNHKPNN